MGIFYKDSSHEEGVRPDMYQMLDKPLFQEPPELQNQVDPGKQSKMFCPSKLIKIKY